MAFIYCIAICFSVCFPARAASAENDISYIDIDVLARAFSLQKTWAKDNETLTLSNRTGTINLTVKVNDYRSSLNGVNIYLGQKPQSSRRQALSISEAYYKFLFAPILACLVTPPGKASPLLVAIDAGHGGQDPGTSNSAQKVYEKNATLDVAQALRTELLRLGFRVVMTRDSDRFVGLPDRMATVMKANADILVCIHFNWYPLPTIRGTETYFLAPVGQQSQRAEGADVYRMSALPGHRYSVENARLSFAVHRNIVTALGSYDRGLKPARLYMLRNAPCPTVYIEALSVSNAEEVREIRNPDWQRRLAAAIAAGIVSYASQPGAGIDGR